MGGCWSGMQNMQQINNYAMHSIATRSSLWHTTGTGYWAGHRRVGKCPQNTHHLPGAVTILPSVNHAFVIQPF